MTFHPVLEPLLLTILVAVVVAARAVTLRRLWTSKRRTRAALWRWAGVTAAAVLLLVAATRPVIGGDLRTTPAGSADGEPNVFLVVDRSPGMGVADSSGRRSRMDGVRDDVAAVLDRYQKARIGVITFASGPSVEWPLSPDTWSLRPVLDAMEPRSAGVEDPYDTNVAAAGTVLRYQLIAARQQFPSARNLVFYFGAGAGESRAPQREFELAEGSVDGGAVLGYGTVAGGAIPQSPVRSGLDERALRAVADQLGVPYLARTRGGPLPDVIAEDAAARDAAPETLHASSGPTETYWMAAMAAAVLILVELYLALRDLRRTRPKPLDVTS
jgi:Ca-activated chloride channel homolog